MSYADLEGFFDAGIAKLYSHVAWQFPSGSKFVEVGTYEGKSTAYMAEQLKLYNKEIEFYVVDIWKNYGQYLSFRRNMIQLGLNHLMKPIRAESTLAALQFQNESLDFVFLDADHRYSAIRADILSWLPKVKPNGILAGHDYSENCPGVVKAINELFGYKNIKLWKTTWIYKK
jgi:predicted O-methyltransferase YrrM